MKSSQMQIPQDSPLIARRVVSYEMRKSVEEIVMLRKMATGIFAFNIFALENNEDFNDPLQMEIPREF